MDQPTEPLDALRADIEGAVHQRLRNARWWVRKFVGAQLVKLLLGGVASVALLVAALPVFAAVAAAAVVAAALGYAVYARKQLVDERTMRRWAYADGKRVQQDVLKRELALDVATLILVNDPADREVAHRLSEPRSPEFAGAVRYLRGQLRVAAAAASERPQPRKAAVHGQSPAASTPPDLVAVRRRRDLRKSEIAKLDAEIQALAAPDVIDLAVAAEDAGRAYKNRRAAVHLADRIARERRQRGRKATERGPNVGLNVAFHVNGDRDVTQTQTQTPEQIARGEQLADGSP